MAGLKNRWMTTGAWFRVEKARVDDKALVKARHCWSVALQMLGRLKESLDDHRFRGFRVQNEWMKCQGARGMACGDVVEI